MPDGALPSNATARFGRKQEAIIAAATEILNHRGVKGMTLAGVAEKVGLITTSVTYYFKKKEELAAACFFKGLERIDAMAVQALQAPTVEGRIHALFDLYLNERRRICQGEVPPIPVFNDVRALADPGQKPVIDAYFNLFRRVRLIFRAPGLEWMDRTAATARTQILLEQLHWLEAWAHRYDIEDYPRIRDRMVDILLNGLAPAGAVWAPVRLDSPVLGPDAARETFLLAATRLINESGYRGASVEKISAVLNVTKGSFYHHHNAKDDLVVECFERTFEVSRRVQASAKALDADQWTRLASAAANLVEYQISDKGPQLRMSALTALPESIREEMVDHSTRVSDRFASMISDGIAEGSIRAVDPVIAAQMLNATLNAAADLTGLLREIRKEEVAALYAKPMLMGLISN